MEMEQMAENAKTQMEDVSHIHTDFVTATQIGHVKTMFKVVYCTLRISRILCIQRFFLEAAAPELIKLSKDRRKALDVASSGPSSMITGNSNLLTKGLSSKR